MAGARNPWEENYGSNDGQDSGAKPWEQAYQQPEPPKARTWGEAIKDTGAQLAEGVNTTLGAIPSVVAPQSKAAGFFRDNAEHWRDQQSDVLKGRIAASDQRIQEAGKDGVMSQIGTAASEYWNDPAQAARLVATNLPSMAATLGTGAAAGLAAKGVAAARGLDAANKAALAAKYGTTTTAATNAALNAGGARGEAFEDLQKTALAQGMTPEQAEQAGVSGSILPGVVGGVAGAVSGKIGLEKALLGQATTGAAMRKAGGAFGAELAGEQIEELAPKVATNYQVGRIDPGRTLTDDLGRTMVETAIGSGPGAVVAGGAAGMRTGELPSVDLGPVDPTTSPGAADPNAPVPPPVAGPTLALPAPERGVIQVAGDGTARTPAYQAPGYVGDVTDAEPRAVNPVREQVAAAAEQGGALSSAALTAIDTGLSDAMQPAPEQAPPQISLEEADARDQAAYEQFFASHDSDPVVSRYFENDDDIPDFDAASNASEEDFLRALGATDEDIQDAIATTRQPSSPQGSAAGNAGAQANEPAGPREGAGEGAASQTGQVNAGAIQQAAPDAPVPGVGGPVGADGAGSAAAAVFGASGPGGAGTGAATGSGAGATEVGSSRAGGRGDSNQALSAPTNLRDALVRVRQQKQEAANAQVAQAPAPAAAPVPGPAAATIVEAAGVKPAGQRQLSADEQAAQDREEARAKELSLPPVLSARLQEAHKAHGRGVKRSVVERSIANEKANNTGTPKAKRERADRIARLEADLALFDEASAMPPKEAAGPASIPATIGANSEPTPPQAIQAGTQPAQAAAAPAAGPAPTNTAAPAPAGAPEVRALSNGAPTANTGAQAAPAGGTQGNAPRATAEQLTGAQERWQRMTTAERQAVAARTDVKPILRKNLHGAKWENLNVDVQRKLQAAMEPQAVPALATGPVRVGRDNTPLGEGGKPFKTRKAAGDAKKLQPMMRVVTVPGGYALAEKTPAQLAAEERASRRLRNPNTSARGEPIPAHAFIAAAGGLNRVAASDMGVDGNPRIGNRTLLAGQGRGLSMDQATQMLIQDGYLSEGATINDALSLIKTSLTRPQYNADGIERIAQAEADAQFEDYLAAQEDAAVENDEFDPFGPAPTVLDGFSDDMLESSGYDAATDAIKAEVRALLEMANAQGIDTESITLEAHEQTRNATEQDYYEAAKSALEAAITGSNRDRGTPAGSEGQGPGAAAASAEEQGLNQPAALDQQAQAATENVAPAVSTTVDMPPTRQQESSPFARFATGRYRISIRDEGNGPYAEVVAIQRGSGVEVEMRMPGEALDHPAFSQLNARAQALFETPTASMFDAEPPALELAAQTPAEAAARQDAQEQATKAEAAAKRAEDAAAKAEEERKRIAQASVRAADRFELGQDPLDSLTGQGGLAFSFAGARAATADKHALVTAQDRLSAGEDAETVRQETGWFQGNDGKWRFEISDAGARLKDRTQWTAKIDGINAKRDAALQALWQAKEQRNDFLRARGESPSRISSETKKTPEFKALAKALKNAEAAAEKAQDAAFLARQGDSLITVGDVLSHPALFAAYPGIADVRVDINDSLPAGNAAYAYELRAIELSGKSDAQQLLSTLLHEIQHGIQHIEGFAMGGNQDSRADVMQAVSQQRSLWADVYAVRRELDAGKKLDTVLEEWQEFLDAQPSAEALRIAQDPELETSVALQNMETLERQYAQLRNEGRGDTYRRLAGEVEARNTQARQGMTDEQRRATPPSQTADVADSRVIVMFNGKEMESAPEPANAEQRLADAEQRLGAPLDKIRADSNAHNVATQMLVDGLTEKWTRAPEIIVARNMQDPQVPQAVRDYDAELKSQGSDGEARGFIYKGKVYLLSDQLKGPQQIAEVLFHEVLGHYGLRGAFGESLTPILQQIGTMRRKEVVAKAREYGLFDKDALGGLDKKAASDAQIWAAMSPKDRLSAAEEVLAEMAQTQPTIGFVQRAIAAIRNWLRTNVPGFERLRLTDSDIIQAYLIPARGFVTRSKETGAQSLERAMAAFSRTPGDQTQTEAFKRWFAGSRVVDADGKPLVVYHGTRREFTTFDYSKIGEQGRAEGAGFYFTNSEKVASGYGAVMEVFLSIKKPLAYDAKPFSTSVVQKIVARVAELEAQDEGGDIADGFLANFGDVRSEGLKRVIKTAADMIAADETALDQLSGIVGSGVRPQFVNQATRDVTGFDGVVANGFSNAGDAENRIYVAFFPEQIKSATGNNGNFDPANPDIRFSRAPVAPAPAAAATSGWDAPVQTGFDDVIYKLQDKNIDLKRVVESITKSAGHVADSINAYLKEELFHKRAAKRVEDFGARELKPLMNQMRLAGLSMEDVEEYLHARHAKEANAVIAQRNPGNAGLQDGGSGMTNAAADNYFAKLDPTQRRKLEAVAKSVDAIIEGTRKLYVDYGLEDQAVVDGWANMYQHYIPLMREDKDGGMGTGQGFSVKGKETKGRTGSTRKVVDILANVAMQREKLIVRGEKNIVAQALVGLAQANPNPDFWEVRSEAPTERVFDQRTGVVVERPDPLFKSRENVVVTKVKDANGNVTEQMVVFNEDNPRAVRMAAAMKNLDAGNLEGLLGMSAKITRYFSAINTQYNPVFGVVNLVRDVQGAMVNLAATPLAGQQGKIAKDTVSALRGIYSDIRKTRRGGQATSQWAALWEQMQDDGGTTGYRELFTTSADRANNLKSILNPEAWMDNKWGKFFTANGQLKVPMSIAQKGATEIFGWLSDYNEAMENGVRLAAYKAALDKGMSREQAASLAKNLTVNFNRKGQVGMQAGAVYAFFNAAMQGTARIGQTLFDMDGGDISTLRLSKTGKAVVYGGVTLGVMQALALAGAGFDEEDPPEFVRERSLIIPTGGKTYVSIPMPLGLHVIPGIGRHATEFALSGFDKPAKRALSVIGMFADAFNPIGNAGLSMQTIAPTALDPLVALSENKDWTGKPIARVSSNKAMPGHTQWKDTATGFSKVVAEAINWISGGNEYVAGAFSPTPDQIDYLLAQVGGGVAREAAKVQQTISTAMSGETLPTHKIPLVGRFVGNAASQASQGSAFYANLNKLNALETEIKGLRKDGRFDEAAKLVRENPQATMIAMANRAERDVQKLRRDKRELIAKDASREEVRAKEDQITAVMMRLNEAAERRKAN